MTDIRIGASILSADFARLGEHVREAESAGVDFVHIDVMDGRFVPNITMGPLIVDAVRRSSSLMRDVHLMIVEPERYVEAFAEAGADRITVHHEASPNLHRTLSLIREVGCKAGIAINPHTPASVLEEIIDMLDVVVVMTVNPGFGGQSLIPATLPKLARVRALIDTAPHEIDLLVDGGINLHTAHTAAQHGAKALIAGSALFSQQFTVRAGVDAIRQALAHPQSQS